MKCIKCKKEITDNSIYCNWCGKKQTATQRRRRKRPHGTGTVSKRKDLKETPWVALTPYKKGQAREPIGYFATEKEADDALAEFRQKPTTKLNITLEELYKEWWPIGLKGKSEKTEETYSVAFKKLESLENKKFKDLRTGQFQKIIDDMEEKEGLSHSSMHHVKVLLGRLYKYAMQHDIINKNYAQFIKLPKKPKGVKPAFSELELKTIEKNINKVEFADCIYFLCYTGLRITEFVELTRFSVYQKNGDYSIYGGIKTDAGKERIVPVHTKVKLILEKWMAKKGDTVFCRPDGTRYTTDYFRRKCFYPALEKMEIQEDKAPRRLTPHAARRTFATMLSSAGVQEEDMIAMMGHTDFDVTIDSYIYQTAEKLKPAIEKIP